MVKNKFYGENVLFSTDFSDIMVFVSKYAMLTGCKTLWSLCDKAITM